MKLLLVASTLLCLTQTPGVAQFIPPTPSAQATPGDKALTAYFQQEVAALSGSCLAEIQTFEDWQARRDEYRRQLQEMLGLLPMPARTDLQPIITGRLAQDEFTVEKLHFQPSPRLYATANLYLPRKANWPAPTVLYLCGHLRVMTNGISLGNKAAYQQEGAWFARNGYVCLVLDTLLLGEIQSVHTGTRDRGLWWWNSRGYTPAGVEAWFGIRALDYLCTRPEVDTNRFGVTGHSGGGAYSWTVTALDDRIKVAAPLAGMLDARGHVLDNLMDSHCDCNFFINTYRWDFPQLAALAAPRPLLIGGTDHDRIFPLESTIRIHDQVRRVYQLNNAADNLALTLAPGPHEPVPELQLAVMRWFNRFLKGDNRPVETVPSKCFDPMLLRVFDKLPADAINTNIAETFVEMAGPKPQTGSGARNQFRQETLTLLREKVFNGWPREDIPLSPQRVFAVERDQVRFSAWDFVSHHDVTLRVYFLEGPRTKSGARVHLDVLEHRDWSQWSGRLRTRFAAELRDELAASGAPPADAIGWQSLRERIITNESALAFFAPRGMGLDAWSGDDKRLTKIRRRFMAVGQTLDGMRVWDIRRAVQTTHFVREADGADVILSADRPLAANALHAAMFEPGVKRLILRDPAPEPPDYLNILRVMPPHSETELTDARIEIATRRE